jgi:hypothetical protein
MDDLNAAGVAPSIVSVVAKTKFDAEIRGILARCGALPAEAGSGAPDAVP